MTKIEELEEILTQAFEASVGEADLEEVLEYEPDPVVSLELLYSDYLRAIEIIKELK